MKLDEGILYFHILKILKYIYIYIWAKRIWAIMRVLRVQTPFCN